MDTELPSRKRRKIDNDFGAAESSTLEGRRPSPNAFRDSSETVLEARRLISMLAADLGINVKPDESEYHQDPVSPIDIDLPAPVIKAEDKENVIKAEYKEDIIDLTFDSSQPSALAVQPPPAPGQRRIPGQSPI